MQNVKLKASPKRALSKNILAVDRHQLKMGIRCDGVGRIT